VADSLLDEIIQDTLESVMFTQSGVVLDFGDAWFTAHVWPTISIAETVWAFGDRGYRDALCAFISHPVTAVDSSPETGLVLAFGLGSITTNPEPTDPVGPEIAQLAIYNPMHQISRLAVWRPSEAPYTGSAWS